MQNGFHLWRRRNYDGRSAPGDGGGKMCTYPEVHLFAWKIQGWRDIEAGNSTDSNIKRKRSESCYSSSLSWFGRIESDKIINFITYYDY